MKRPRRRGKTQQALPVEEAWPEADGPTDAELEDEARITGWRASTAGLSGLATLTQIGAWVLVASGPLLGIAALVGSSSPAPGVPKAAPTSQQASGTGPSGFAQLYVAAYLKAGEGTEADLSPYFSGPVVLTSPPNSRSASQTVVVRIRAIESGYWSVTVAVRVASRNTKGAEIDAGVQYYRVGVQVLGPATADGSSTSGDITVGYTATSLPAQVAAPAALKPGELGYDTSGSGSTSGPATETVSFFLNAYLASSGELDRYTSPGVRLQPVSPAPYTEVKVTDVHVDSASAGEHGVPGDGATRRLLVTVDATDQDGRTFPLSYALTLTSRAGRWEVASLDDAPALKPGSKPSAAPTNTPGPDSEDAAASPTPSSS